MSISVDDLVASLSSNHIGQEAIDLANLHAQLAQALRAQPLTSAQPAVHRGHAPSNTPLARTPSASFSWDPSEFARARSSSGAGATNATHRWGLDERLPEVDDMDEDERMVEDLLFSSPTTSQFPSSQGLSSGPSSASGMLSRKPSIPHIQSSYEPLHADLPSPNTSLFATTDPFFVAQLQAAQNPVPSFFAQAGRPSSHSPFLLAHQFQSAYGHAHAHHTSEVDPHHIFTPTPATFTC